MLLKEEEFSRKSHYSPLDTISEDEDISRKISVPVL